MNHNPSFFPLCFRENARLAGWLALFHPSSDRLRPTEESLPFVVVKTPITAASFGRQPLILGLSSRACELGKEYRIPPSNLTQHRLWV